MTDGTFCTFFGLNSIWREDKPTVYHSQLSLMVQPGSRAQSFLFVRRATLDAASSMRIMLLPVYLLRLLLGLLRAARSSCLLVSSQLNPSLTTRPFNYKGRRLIMEIKTDREPFLLEVGKTDVSAFYIFHLHLSYMFVLCVSAWRWEHLWTSGNCARVWGPPLAPPERHSSAGRW